MPSHRTVRFRTPKVSNAPIVGPALTAIRTACTPHSEHLGGLAPVFERIGQHVDATVAQPDYDGFFPAAGRRILVVVSDVLWGNLVLLTDYGVEDVALVMSETDRFYARFAGGEFSDGICQCWADWSRHARKSFRREEAAWNDLASISVGSLLFISPDVRSRLAEITASSDTPVLAIALNSTGTTRKRLKCSVRALAFPLPSWACASGAVAGNA